MIERSARLSSHEFFRNLSGQFRGDNNPNRTVGDADSQPGAPRPPGLDVIGAGLGIRPDPPAGWPLADCYRGGGVR